MAEQSTIRVLLVDDEETLLKYLSKRLLKQGFSVKVAFSGQEAIDASLDAHYDVAVVDLKMPEMDGVETQKKLKEIQPFLQCIVLTGHGSVETALESGQQDAFQYLLKPVDYDNLLAVIKEAYEKKIDLQRSKFSEQVAEIQSAGLGARGLRKAIAELREIYGVE
jgi:two-component system NtrC family response regulator